MSDLTVKRKCGMLSIGAGGGNASTWQHHQPRRVMGKPNRIARQAGVLPRVLKGDIVQGQNL